MTFYECKRQEIVKIFGQKNDYPQGGLVIHWTFEASCPSNEVEIITLRYAFQLTRMTLQFVTGVLAVPHSHFQPGGCIESLAMSRMFSWHRRIPGVDPAILN